MFFTIQLYFSGGESKKPGVGGGEAGGSVETGGGAGGEKSKKSMKQDAKSAKDKSQKAASKAPTNTVPADNYNTLKNVSKL